MSNLSHHLHNLHIRPGVHDDGDNCVPSVLEHIRNELLADLPEPQTAEPGAYEARLWYVEGFNRAIGKMEWVITQYCEGEKDEA